MGHRLLLTLEHGDVMPAPREKPGNIEAEDAASDDCDSLSQFGSVPSKTTAGLSNSAFQNINELYYICAALPSPTIRILVKKLPCDPNIVVDLSSVLTFYTFRQLHVSTF